MVYFSRPQKLSHMYIAVAMVMLVRGFADAVMMRSQQLLSAAGETGLPPHHYDQIFTVTAGDRDFLRSDAFGYRFDEHHRSM